MDKPRNFVISGVELNWAKLVNPQSPFGTSQYEVQIATEDKAKAKELSDNHINMKEKDGKFIASLKRKEFKANGESNGKVRVVDSAKQPLDAGTIGNGSQGNVIVFQYPYDTAGRKGIASSLTAIQVTDLVVYSGSDSVDFEVLESIAPTTTPTGDAISDEMF